MTTAETIVTTFHLDADITSDMEALGIQAAAELDQTRRDALASSLMKRMARETADIAQLEASCAAEIAFIKDRYVPQLNHHQTRLGELRFAVEALAIHTKEADGYGKKKSRDVGAGSYGYKTAAAGVELKDDVAYLTWAEANAPQTLRVKPTMSLATAREYLSETELAGVKREIMKDDVKKLIATDPAVLPPGYEAVPAHDEYYVKPLPLAAITP